MKHIARLSFIAMPLAIIMAFLHAPAADILGESSRLLYFHVPLAWVSAFAFIIAGACSLFHLGSKDGSGRMMALRARNSVELGLLFTVLATVSGSIWSKMSWGSYWNWDPRQTSIVILFLIYVAYFSLDSALSEKPSRVKIPSAYLVLAMAIMPFFMFVVPRIYQSLHPDPVINPSGGIQLEPGMTATLLVSAIAHTLLYLNIFSLKNRIAAIDIDMRDVMK